MKIKSLQMCLIVLFVISNFVQAGEQYWPTIKKYILEYKAAKDIHTAKAAEIKYNEYLSSFSAEQLIEAGRQCSQDVDINNTEATYCEEYLYLISFFGDKYPKAGGLNSLNLIFKEIEDKTQTNLWRKALIDLLGSCHWMELLNYDQMYITVDKLRQIMADQTEPFELRFTSCSVIWHILDNAEDRTLLAEPIIKAKIQNGIELQKLKDDVASGHLQLSDGYKINMVNILKRQNDFSQNLLSVINESELNPALQRSFLIAMENSLKRTTSSTPQIRKSLESSVRNYNKFDKNSWKLLINISYKTLKLQDSAIIAESMISDLQNTLEGEKEKKKINQIQSEIESLEQIVKKQKNK